LKYLLFLLILIADLTYANETLFKLDNRRFGHVNIPVIAFTYRIDKIELSTEYRFENGIDFTNNFNGSILNSIKWRF